MDRLNDNDVAHTGTLPVAGTNAVPVTPEPGETQASRPAWVDARRAELTGPGRYLAYEESGREIVLSLTAETTRIGRSLSAEVRFDDATVSRRHALVIADDDGVKILDDRSLNGVFVNGKRVEDATLEDGDAITVGRHQLFYLDTATVGRAVGAGAAASTN